MFEQRFAAALAERRSADRLRTLRPVAPAGPGRVRREGRELVDFSSNDYLGLSQHPLLIERACEWTRKFGASARASRLVTGTLEAHALVEARLARFKRSEAALLFATGWQANASILPALLKLAPDAQVFADRLIHASLHHGIAASGARQHRFRHNDLDHLEHLLAERGRGAGARLIVTESVFSMDGDRADLARLARIACAHDAFLVVDEAHATGVLGPGGAGLCAGLGLEEMLVMGTFGKALGSFGAYVAGSRALCEYLINACGGFVYSTALPPPVLGAVDAALELVPGMDAERAQVASLAARLRDGLGALGFDTGASDTQIVPVMLGSEVAALAMARRLEQAGLLGVAIRPPTVPDGGSRIRIALSAAHREVDVDALLAALGRAA